jgi:hypothetical protein
MSERQKTLQIKQFNTDYPITLMYDECKSGESNYGPWMLYSVEYEGELPVRGTPLMVSLSY